MEQQHSKLTRSRWAAIGAAVAVTLGAGGIGFVAASSGPTATAFVPIEPCRIADTRSDLDFNVGARNTPLGEGETLTLTAHGDNGECSGIPTSATGLALNVTALDATAPSFLTVWGSGDRPNASHLNPVPAQPPTPNAVTTGLTATGQFNIYNGFGSVDVITDVVGYYVAQAGGDNTELLAQLDALQTQVDALETQVTTLDGELDAKQDACAPGSVLGYAQVQGLGLPVGLTEVHGYTCKGAKVEARRVNTGQYVVRFEGLDTTSTTEGMVVHVTPIGGSGGRIAGYGSFAGNGDVRVDLYDHQGTAVDAVFSISIIDAGVAPES